MRERLQALIAKLKWDVNLDECTLSKNELLAYIQQFEAILAASPYECQCVTLGGIKTTSESCRIHGLHLRKQTRNSVVFQRGWIVKDKLGIRWSTMRPSFSNDENMWLMPGRSVFLNQSVIDPWPDKKDGGIECIVKAQP